MKSQEECFGINCRLDKWLWTARFYKTRRIASESIKNGSVSVEGKFSIKPSSTIMPNSIIFIQNDYLKQKILVNQIAHKRESYEKSKTLYTVLEQEKSQVKEYFDKRLLKKRPSKQERRDLISLKQSSNYLSND